ncbi:biotin carboxylase [Jezberella montanilacus]|uniref:biotin carboxylase n=1 Tax=Jezberella montanilacus TaxID=323426 RepID=A0A2T0XC14_9BURK|nr:acetyl-CoA carboxylase biotin carboxylase subunit [Jezberella montanilacus]PRY96475.1 biotin carboxylase [Jezberella montanilacus]
MKKKITKILIANRGEIAVRIIKTCQKMDIQTVQVYSDADENSLAVKLADETVNIGPGPALQSYFNIEKIISVAKQHAVDAIHPGYGFLSEKAEFAMACLEAGISFIGPHPETLIDMGDKARAKLIAQQAGVPVSPGSTGEILNSDDAIKIANSIGYPVIIKASAGGGGRGMKVFYDEQEIRRNYEGLATEALRSFANSALYVEKYFENIRHIEVQVLCDQEDIYVLGERDCSIQRKNQKLIEECPAVILTSDVSALIYEASKRICAEAKYLNVGTIEYLYDLNTSKFYFLEMNTRIQVEHPVTEMCFNFDLVEAQIKVASGEKLGLDQNSLISHGHSIECRINAENPDKKFMPSPGTIIKLKWPTLEGVRIDSHVFEGYTIPIYYDSLIAKIICWSHSRDEAIELMKQALGELQIEGIKTTASFHESVMADASFGANQYDTRFLNRFFE